MGTEHNRYKNIDKAVFTINGKVYTGDSTLPLNTSLNTFIRNYASLPGTKYMCKEGSCGSCVVNLKYRENTTKKIVSCAINSCLMPVLACHGTAILTVEGIGSKKAGYNKVQTTLASFNGTQCGFCSPGFVMTMYSLLDQNPKATMTDVESQFSGNLCRCTGYRPILDAFKSLSSNPPTDLRRRLLDIEESHICPNRSLCSGSNGVDCSNCTISEHDQYELDFVELALGPENLILNGTEQEWYRPSLLKEIFEIFNRIGSKSYMLLAGNTARGVKKPVQEPQVYIDINNVTELQGYEKTSKTLNIGGVTRLKEFIDILRDTAANNANTFAYCSQMADHLTLVANIPVRNRATISGNLSLVNVERNFPSDVFLLLDALSAKITIANVTGIKRDVSTTEFRSTNLNKKVITRITLPASNESTVLKSYKIMPVSQTAVAIVNGAFLFDVNKNGNLNRKPSIVFSGINQEFRHANNTENYLQGKNIFNENVLKQSLEYLWEEVKPDNELTSFSPKYRKLLAAALLYRSILSLAGDKVSAKNRSGSTELIRPISSGKQVYQTHSEEYPLTQPMTKLEALIQTAGEATFVNDLPLLRRELFGHLVLAKKFADIVSIDPSKALKIEGVVGFYSAGDIPGQNIVSFLYPIYIPVELELFSTEVTRFWGQPVGIIVAQTEELAERAANDVIIHYKTDKRPLLTAKDVMASAEKDKRIILVNSQKASKTGSGKFKFEGKLESGTGYQYAHSIETTTCKVEPQEDNQYRIWVATQSLSATKKTVSQVMGLPQNKIDCMVGRVGGSFGAKNTTQLYATAACTLAASKLSTPVRMVMTVENEMDALGKRFSHYVTYKGETDETGKIQTMDLDIYVETGYTTEKPNYFQILTTVQNYFDSSSWNVNVYAVITDKPPIVILRGPGFMDAISMIEQIMDHVAFEAKVNPIDIRLVNSNDTIINDHIRNWKTSTEFDKRLQDIDTFNQENRWKKKGLALTAMKYFATYMGARIGCQIDIIYPDGTVQVQHGGIEIGQGINTKVAQAVAHELNIPISSIQIKPFSTLSSSNNTATLGSVTSELAVLSALNCCKKLNSDLAPIKASLKDPKWIDVVDKAYNNQVALSVSLPLSAPPDEKNQMYFIYGVCVSETELDILTGRHQILRVDILEDAGKSMSPEIDVGQVEGGFIMALGIHTTERNIFDAKTGALLTDRLWFYHVPRSKDIPVDFRITFVPNATNPIGVLNSKATGEPSTALAISVVNSIRNGLKSARKDAGLPDSWIYLDSPCTPETISLASGTSYEQFTF